MIYKKRKGMKVEIFDARLEKKLGIGIYINSKKIGLKDIKYWTPRFKLGKKIIHGYECWWTPLSVIKRKGKGGNHENR